MIVLDTNVISELYKQQPDPAVSVWLNRQQPAQLYLTSITLGEIDLDARAPKPSRRQDALLAWCDQLQTVMFANRILPFDEHCARLWGRVVQSGKKRGRRLEWRDSQIAATVLHTGARLATRDVKHFDGLDIDLVNPFGEL
jgi:predicted nucleic acid-binding protein